MPVSWRYTVFHEQKHTCLGAAIFLTSLFALTTLPTFIPLVLNLSLLLIYAPILFNDRFSIARCAVLCMALAAGKSISWLTPSLNALSTPAMSILVLIVHGLVTSFMTLFVVFVYTRSRTRIPRWSHATLFPALWASAWCALPYVSPVGFLTSWSPIAGINAYGWIIPIFGPSTRDWLAAAWAVVLSETVESWYMGSEGPEEQPLIPHPVAEDVRSTSSARTFRGTLVLGLALSALTVPSFLRPDVALPVISSETTPLEVGCVLPPIKQYKHHAPTLDDFISESRKLTSANILLWPEGAVSFADEAERNAALVRVQKEIRGPYVGVSFEESYSDPSDPSGRRSLRRTGMALVSNYSTDLHMIYFKRNLVPIAESYRLEGSDNPPPLYTIDLRAPKYMKRIDWAPPPYVRPVSVTASICLDFAKPSVFADLESKPALILAPARTWDLSIGKSMWEQGKQRARELDTTILWCDGGEGGVSGVAGPGISEPTQVGEGSWVRGVGLQYPFEESRTFYAKNGDFCVLAYWVLVLGGFAFLLPVRVDRRIGLANSIWNGIRQVRQRVLEWREKRALTQVENGTTVHTSNTPLPETFKSREKRSVVGRKSIGKRLAWGATSTLVPSFRSRIARSLRATLPDSTRRPSTEDSVCGGTTELLSAERDSEWTDDFCHITRDELPIQLDDPPSTSTPASSSATLRPGGANPSDSLHSRFSLNRLKNYSHVSIRRTKSKAAKVARLPFLSKKSAESNHSILDDFPEPPSHIPTPITPSPAAYAWPSARPFDGPVPAPDEVVQEHWSSREIKPSKSSDPLASINTCAERSETSLANRQGTVGRLRSIARTLTARLAIRDSHSKSQTSASAKENVELRSQSTAFPIPAKDTAEHQSQKTRVHTRSLPLQPPAKPLPDVPVRAAGDMDPPEPRRASQSRAYQLVNPLELKASPSPLLGADFPAQSTRDSFVPPSPSWLGRNVQHLEPTNHPQIPEITIEAEEDPAPSSPSPLPIPPRILIRNASNASLLSPLEATAGWLEYPEYRGSLISVSRTSSSGSIVEQRGRELLYKQDLPEALLLKATANSSVPTPTAAIPSPLPIPTSPSYFSFVSHIHLHQSHSVSSSPDSKPTLVSDSPRDLYHSEPHPDFSYVFSNLHPESDVPLAHMDFAKYTDVVDFGGGVDYSNMQWFKEAPPPHVRAPPPPPQPAGAPYIPDQAVIEQNEAFEFALKAAPNVLYARYKQYGQLGVLAWCSEFGELIDNLKDLGFAGNMFVSTRTQALKTCEEILKLQLDIAMQIIVLYLSSQVARLRRFLDGEHVWDDYPEPSFPLDPNAYAPGK